MLSLAVFLPIVCGLLLLLLGCVREWMALFQLLVLGHG